MPLSMYIFDIPDVHEYKNKNATKFLKKLSETEHIELFKSPSVRAIVEMKWPLVKTVMTKYLLYPFLLLNFAFLFYATYIFENLDSGTSDSTVTAAATTAIAEATSTANATIATAIGSTFNYAYVSLAEAVSDPTAWTWDNLSNP